MHRIEKEQALDVLMPIDSLQPLEDGLGDLFRSGFTAEIGGPVLTLEQDGIYSSVDPGCWLDVVHRREHERSGSDRRDRVGDSLALNVGRGAVYSAD